jgi:rubredoxin
MRIIKFGVTDKKTKQFICNECGCVFEADKDEYRLADQMEAMHDGIETVCVCPHCKSKVYRYM